MVTRICKPWDRVDEGLRTKFFSSARGICADGARLRASAWLRRRSMPNVRLIVWDPTHMARASIKDPLVRIGHFAEIRHRCSPVYQIDTSAHQQVQECPSLPPCFLLPVSSLA